MADEQPSSAEQITPEMFRRMVEGMTAWTSGRLKISGDLMFTLTLGTWFKQPEG